MKKSIQIIALTIFFSMIGVLFSTPTSATNIPTSVTIKPSLGLTLSSSSVVLNLDPTTNPFDNETVNIVVGTNNPTGYWVTMSSNNNDTNLVNTNDTTKTIPTLESNISEADFPTNYWGYKVSGSNGNSGTDDSNTNYLPYVSGATIASNNTKVNNDTTNLTIASKIDYLSVPGLYKQTFNFTALPHITNYYMQDLSDPTLAQEVCRTDAPSIVIDKRDEQAYTIQRLDDGKCWMLDNLNLDLTNKAVVDNITTANTNVDAASLKSLKEGNRGAGTRYATEGLSLSNWTTDDSSNTKPMTNKSGTCSTSSDYPCTYNGNYTNNTVLSTLTPDQSTFGLGSGKIGIYYNYCAASAGNYCYDDTGDGVPPSGAKADYDICPSSWRMPVGGTNGEYRSLCTAINGSACGTYVTMEGDDSSSMQYKLSATLSGTYFDSILFRQGSFGYFWSSSSYPGSALDNYYLDLGSSFVKPYAAYPRLRGFSVRCLLQE